MSCPNGMKTARAKPPPLHTGKPPIVSADSSHFPCMTASPFQESASLLEKRLTSPFSLKTPVIFSGPRRSSSRRTAAAFSTRGMLIFTTSLSCTARACLRKIWIQSSSSARAAPFPNPPISPAKKRNYVLPRPSGRFLLKGEASWYPCSP